MQFEDSKDEVAKHFTFLIWYKQRGKKGKAIAVEAHTAVRRRGSNIF
jgi:hypothetical protein